MSVKLKTLVICTMLLFVSLFYIYPIGVEAIPSDQNTVLTKSWTLPLFNQDRGYAITSSFSGNEIYFVDSNENKIGRLAPLTNTITLWDIPTANSFPTSVKFDPSTGSVYFIESNSSKIGRLAPETNAVTEWSLQSNSSDSSVGNSSGITDNTRQFSSLSVDPSTGSVYFVESNSNKIGRLAPETNAVTEWSLQSNSSDSSVGNSSGITDNTRQFSSLSVNPSTGSVYFVESNTNKIGRLAPETNAVTEWSLQSNSTQLESMTLGFGGNEIYFVNSNENKIGRLAPLTNLITEYYIPTANSFPTSVKFDPSTGSVYFVESNTNKIGRLLPFQSEFTEWKLNEKPNNIEVDSAGSIYYINENGNKLVRMD